MKVVQKVKSLQEIRGKIKCIPATLGERLNLAHNQFAVQELISFQQMKAMCVWIIANAYFVNHFLHLRSTT